MGKERVWGSVPQLLSLCRYLHKDILWVLPTVCTRRCLPYYTYSVGTTTMESTSAPYLSNLEGRRYRYYHYVPLCGVRGRRMVVHSVDSQCRSKYKR